jgi:hypothetical protein
MTAIDMTVIDTTAIDTTAINTTDMVTTAVRRQTALKTGLRLTGGTSEAFS